MIRMRSLKTGGDMDGEYDAEPTGEHSGEVRIAYASGEVAHARLHGSGAELEAGLAVRTLQLPPTFVRQRSMASFRMFNRSSAVVRFSWRTHAHTEAEGRLGDAAGSQHDPHARRFCHDVFDVDPMEGCIWPGGEVEVCVLFAPEREGACTALAWCQVEGRVARLPLSLQGQGLGPLAIFPFEALDVKDALVGAPYVYELDFMNRGFIDAAFRLRPHMPAAGAPEFALEPVSGLLPAGASQVIRARMVARAVGPFSQRFEWELEGAAEPIRLTIRGRAVPPAIKADVASLDFGLLACGFSQECAFALRNTSAVPAR
ncbi:hypothetical protein WJX81_006184 [Elliptochloris bilobata]|uniref:HYDIN/VesB/CFA65-like Ig-like domain-containing protein n=1 Tax=Elliptochloris bilobata TaxID=381761 RepID=A0AAW1SCH9_9CHLO